MPFYFLNVSAGIVADGAIFDKAPLIGLESSSSLRLHKTPAVGIMPLSKELTVAKEDVV